MEDNRGTGERTKPKNSRAENEGGNVRRSAEGKQHRPPAPRGPPPKQPPGAPPSRNANSQQDRLLDDDSSRYRDEDSSRHRESGHQLRESEGRRDSHDPPARKNKSQGSQSRRPAQSEDEAPYEDDALYRSGESSRRENESWQERPKSKKSPTRGGEEDYTENSREKGPRRQVSSSRGGNSTSRERDVEHDEDNRDIGSSHRKGRGGGSSNSRERDVEQDEDNRNIGSSHRKGRGGGSSAPKGKNYEEVEEDYMFTETQDFCSDSMGSSDRPETNHRRSSRPQSAGRRKPMSDREVSSGTSRGGTTELEPDTQRPPRSRLDNSGRSGGSRLQELEVDDYENEGRGPQKGGPRQSRRSDADGYEEQRRPGSAQHQGTRPSSRSSAQDRDNYYVGVERNSFREEDSRRGTRTNQRIAEQDWNGGRVVEFDPSEGQEVERRKLYVQSTGPREHRGSDSSARSTPRAMQRMNSELDMPLVYTATEEEVLYPEISVASVDKLGNTYQLSAPLTWSDESDEEAQSKFCQEPSPFADKEYSTLRPGAQRKEADDDDLDSLPEAKHLELVAEKWVPNRGSCQSKADQALGEDEGISPLLKAESNTEGMFETVIIRDRTGINRIYPQYRLYFQNSNTLALVAQKQGQNRTSNYHIFDMTRPGINSHLSKKNGNYIGKLRSNLRKTENTIFTNDQEKEELGAILFEKSGLIDQVKEGSQPRRMKVLLPRVDHEGNPISNKPLPERPDCALIERLKSGNAGNLFYYQNKDPVFEKGNYRLNFHGRVTVASVKNFQLVSPDNIDYIVCQFGKVHDDRFHLDFRAPLNALQAFSIALCHFNL